MSAAAIELEVYGPEGRQVASISSGNTTHLPRQGEVIVLTYKKYIVHRVFHHPIENKIKLYCGNG